MIQGYKITCIADGRVYHGITFADGADYESRTENELSGRKRVNERFAAALAEHGRYAFTVEKVADYNSLYEAILDEAERIKRDDSTHPDKGFNVEKIDKKRLAKAQAEYVPPTDVESLLAAAWIDFRANHSEAWTPYDTPANVKLVSDLAVDEKISIASAFQRLVESGAIALAVTTA